jgi:hypothetical protein
VPAPAGYAPGSLMAFLQEVRRRVGRRDGGAAGPRRAGLGWLSL